MSLDNLQKAIFEEAKQKITVIRADAEKQLASEEKRIKDKAKQIEETLIAQANQEGLQESQKIHQQAQMQGRAEVLKAKQAALDEIFELACQSILNWDQSKSAKLLSALVQLVPATEAGTITVGSVHLQIVSELAEFKNLKIDNNAIAGEGGFIFRGEKTELNLTIKHLMRQVFLRHRSHLAKTLFD